MFKPKLLSLALLASMAIGAPSLSSAAPTSAATNVSQSQPVIDPARQIQEMARLFRAGDAAGLARALVPASRWEEVKLTYELAQLEPISDEDREEFEEKLQKITAADAVDQLMAQIEPELEKARPQLPGALMMGLGGLQVAISSPESKLSEEQRAALAEMLPGLSEWAYGTDFLSSDRAREALTVLTEAARRTGVRDLDQLRALPLDSVLAHGSALLAAGKKAVKLYGIDLDQIADSLQVETLEVNGDTAKVRTTVTLFGAPVWAEHELQLVEGRWYGKGTVHHLHRHDQPEVEAEVAVEG